MFYKGYEIWKMDGMYVVFKYENIMASFDTVKEAKEAIDGYIERNRQKKVREGK